MSLRVARRSFRRRGCFFFPGGSLVVAGGGAGDVPFATLAFL